MKNYWMLFLALLLCSCTKVEDLHIQTCSITFYFNRTDTKGRTNASERSYNSFCSDVDKFIENSEKSFQQNEPTATKVTYKTKIN